MVNILRTRAEPAYPPTRLSRFIPFHSIPFHSILFHSIPLLSTDARTRAEQSEWSEAELNETTGDARKRPATRELFV